MLIGDVHGLPLLPYTLAEPIGKNALNLKNQITGEKAKAKKKAKRGGADPEEAAVAVLRRPVALKLPTAAEITAAWKQLSRAAAQPAAAEPAAAAPAAEAEAEADSPTPTPTPSVPAPGPTRMKRLRDSEQSVDAICMAVEIELLNKNLHKYHAQLADPGRTSASAISRWPREMIQEDIFNSDRSLKWCEDKYTKALSEMKVTFPTQVCCDAFETGGCVHGKPCECGWKQAPWPWIVYRPRLHSQCAKVR